MFLKAERILLSFWKHALLQHSIKLGVEQESTVTRVRPIPVLSNTFLSIAVDTGLASVSQGAISRRYR
jgi:hypothetical protein